MNVYQKAITMGCQKASIWKAKRKGLLNDKHSRLIYCTLHGKIQTWNFW